MCVGFCHGGARSCSSNPVSLLTVPSKASMALCVCMLSQWVYVGKHQMQPQWSTQDRRLRRRRWRKENSPCCIVPLGAAGELQYVWLLFVDYSSEFSTILSDRLMYKLVDLRLPLFTCLWIVEFLKSRKQSVRVGPRTSTALSLAPHRAAC